jgi:PiT family inorganic phosphate transporter
LILTCTGVSFAHGSNDGQKGMGLIMLILIGIIPGAYALNMSADHATLTQIVAAADAARPAFVTAAGGVLVPADAANDTLSAFLKTTGKESPATFAALAAVDQSIADQLRQTQTFTDLSIAKRSALRTDAYLVSESISKLDKKKLLPDPAVAPAREIKSRLEHVTKFIPTWVKFAVAIALGLGTMIGWKRIVVTVGEKIGKEHLTYAQGASAEVVAMITIGAADYFGLPVSTTHVLSSGVAGTMAANRSGLQMGTLRNLLLAWVLTLPVCVLLGATTFAAGLYVVLHVFGVR